MIIYYVYIYIRIQQTHIIRTYFYTYIFLDHVFFNTIINYISISRLYTIHHSH